jgi:hypothetical protein
VAAHHHLTASPTRDWDAASYDRVSDPQVRWAAAGSVRFVLADLAPRRGA